MNAEMLWLLLTGEGIDISLKHCAFMVHQKKSTVAGVTVSRHPSDRGLVMSFRDKSKVPELIDENWRVMPLTEERRALWALFAARENIE